MRFYLLFFVELIKMNTPERKRPKVNTMQPKIRDVEEEYLSSCLLNGSINIGTLRWVKF